MADAPDQSFYLWSHDQGQWYGKQKGWFTPAIRDAGRFRRSGAISICKRENNSGVGAAPNVVMVPVAEMNEAYRK